MMFGLIIRVKFLEIQEVLLRISDWQKRMEEELEHAPSGIFSNCVSIVQEMKILLEQNKL